MDLSAQAELLDYTPMIDSFPNLKSMDFIEAQAMIWVLPLLSEANFGALGKLSLNVNFEDFNHLDNLTLWRMRATLVGILNCNSKTLKKLTLCGFTDDYDTFAEPRLLHDSIVRELSHLPELRFVTLIKCSSKLNSFAAKGSKSKLQKVIVNKDLPVRKTSSVWKRGLRNRRRYAEI